MNSSQRLVMTVVILAVCALVPAILSLKYVPDQTKLYSIVSQKIIILVLCVIIILSGGCIIDLYSITNKNKNDIVTKYNRINRKLNEYNQNNRKLNERKCGSRT
tara:strand:- start:7847 stop:8158 length:312 start_codon:yes stop_codon:yes gene_type:complete